MKLSPLYVRFSLTLLFVLTLVACADPVIEQTRYEYVNSSGRTMPISYEVASDWEVGNGGTYYLPGVEHKQGTLSFDVDSAQMIKETLSEKLKRMTRRAASDKDRKILTTKMINVNGIELLSYGEQGEASYKPYEDRYFAQKVEFVSGSYLIEVSIRGRSDYYPVLLKQLEYTLNSIELPDDHTRMSAVTL